MKVIAPTAVTSAMLVSASVPEDDYPAWASGTTYALGDRVILAATHRIYESAIAGNVGKEPTTSAEWVDIGPTNRWAMFDNVVGTSTVGIGDIDVTLAPGRINRLAALEVAGDLVRVRVHVDGTTVYDQTKSTNAGGKQITDWYEYFTLAAETVTTLIFTDLPSIATAQVDCTITGPDPGGPVSVGAVIVGNHVDLGLTETSPTIGISDFSRKVTDEFGRTEVVERPWSKRMTVRSMVRTARVDAIQRALAGLRARPALYVGEDNFDCLAIYGFYKDFSIDLALEELSYCSFTIEGLV